MKYAFVKYCGLASGGSERYLQTYAMILSKLGHEIDYFYTNSAPNISHSQNDEPRRLLLESQGINVIPIKVKEYHREGWVGTDFFDHFDEKKYRAVHSAISGLPEYPFNKLNKIDIIHTVHVKQGHDQPNIYKNILLCKWQADLWIQQGGNSSKIEIIPSIVYVPEKTTENFRKELGIPEDAFVYGMHQRNDDGLFSSMPLDAFRYIDGAYFVILGGSQTHREYVRHHNIKNVYFLEHTSDTSIIHKFLQTLDCYAHSKSFGEVCSACIIEAMYHYLPVISHPALDMGHAEMIGDCGKMVTNANEYATEMKLLRSSRNYYTNKREMTKQKYESTYAYPLVENKIKKIYEILL